MCIESHSTLCSSVQLTLALSLGWLGMRSVLHLSHSPFPHLLRSKRLWQPWSSNNNNDSDNWNTSEYFTNLTEVMADSLSSLCPHETRSSSALLLCKVLQILLSFPHLLRPPGIWHQGCNMSLLTDFKVWNWLTFLFPRPSTTSPPPTLRRLSLI